MNCKHPGCRCKAALGGPNGYCSEHCANASQAAGKSPCGCGHPDCK